MFGYTEAQIASFGMTFGVGAFMLYMLSPKRENLVRL
jgi:hypothetical protein